MNAVAQSLVPLTWAFTPAWGGVAGSGCIRTEPEDFQVVEVPRVTPCGEGEHSWLRVRKRGSNTAWVARQLAEFAGVAPVAVGYAGLKDRHAVTEQWFSVHLPGRADPDWQALQQDEFTVLWSQRHTRKLKPGTLEGNRFVLRLRDLDYDPNLLQQRLTRLTEGGFPNYFGTQRFGRDNGNLEAAARMFLQPRRRLARDKRGLYLSAVRSALFNRVLAARVVDASWNRALPGEALQLDARSACFVAETSDENIQQRVNTLEIHPTGPLCGGGDALCQGQAQSLERALLEPFQGWIEGLKRARVDAARRALRAVPRELRWEDDNNGSGRLSFFLPAGSYATSLLNELFSTRDASHD